MASQRVYLHLVLLLTLSWLVLTVSARGGGKSGGYNSGGGTGSETDTDADAGYGATSGSGYETDGEDSFWPGGYGGGYRGGAFGSNGNRAGFDVERAMDYRRIHGILAALAMVLLFPIGSILMRVIPGRLAVWVHAGFQVVTWCVYVAAAGLGIYLARMVQIPGGGLLQNPSTRYHPIIGLVLLALLVIQPVVGFVHHRVFKKVQKRQVWSYMHLTIGRVGITLGIINGGLGLYISNASAYYTRVYAIVAAVMWALWMVVALWAEIRRLKKSRQGKYTAVSKTPRAASEEGGSQE